MFHDLPEKYAHKGDPYMLQVFKDLRNKNKLFSQTAWYNSYWAWMHWDGQKFQMCTSTGQDIFDCARRFGVVIPDYYSPKIEDHVRDVYARLTEVQAAFTKDSLFFVPAENQELLNYASITQCLRFGKNHEYGLAALQVYKEAIVCARTALAQMMFGNMPKDLGWNFGEVLETAAVRVSAYLDTIDYTNKERDIRILLLSNMWESIRDYRYIADDQILCSFIMEPTVTDFVALYPDFTFEKLALTAMKNRKDCIAACGGEEIFFEKGNYLTEALLNRFMGQGREFIEP